MSDKDKTDEPSPPQEGQVAPDFILPASNGERIRLLEIHDTCVVLVFFPVTFTNGSSLEMHMFMDWHVALQSLRVRVLGICVEPVQALQTFAQREQIPFLLLSDFDRDAARRYGVLAEEIDGFKHVAKPSVFLLNKSHKIVYRWVADKIDTMPHLDHVIGIVQGARSGRSIC